jgi:ATP synthase protein I
LPGQDYKWMRKAGLASGIGITLVLATFLGGLMGYGLDRLLGTKPWLLILFTLLGIVAGFVEMFRIVIRLSKD